MVKDSELLKDLLENIPDSIYFKNRDAEFIRVSKSKAEHLNTDIGSIIGKTDFDFYPEEQAQEMYEDDMRVMETGEPIVDKEEKVKRPDGEERWVSVTKVPRYDDEGNIIGMLGISRDISDRIEAEKKVKKAKDRFEELFKGANELIITTDLEGYIQRVNRKTEKVSGYSEEELVGEPIQKIAGPRDQKDYVDLLEKVRQGEKENKVLRGLKKNGGHFWIKIKARPIFKDGEIVEIQYNAQDITVS